MEPGRTLTPAGACSLARLALAGLLLSGLAVPAARAQQTPGPRGATEPRAERLWPAGAPHALGDTDADRPSLIVRLPPAERTTGTAVVVFPGGGYARLAMDHEGHQVAEWLNSLGVAAFIVTYRLGPRYRHPVMLTDAQRAIRTVRARAAEWGVDTARIGVLGFSAGGHLAATAGTHFDTGRAMATGPAAEALERVSARPDFMILIYPVITMADEYTHRGSRQNLLGPDPDPRLVELLSNERQVTPATPPTFLIHSTDDAGVPVENSVLFYTAARRAGVPVEMHLFETGPHGFGLGGDNPVLSRWPSLAEAWMKARGLLHAPGRAQGAPDAPYGKSMAGAPDVRAVP